MAQIAFVAFTAFSAFMAFIFCQSGIVSVSIVTRNDAVWCCCRSLVEATLAALTFAIMSNKAFMAFVASMAVDA